MTQTLTGCQIEAVNAIASAAWLAWMCGGVAEAPRSTSACWLLAHCTDGVTWGRRQDEQGLWQLGSETFPDLCPPIGTVNLIELRLFGEEEELLLWKEGAEIRGRWLTDTSFRASAPDDRHEEDRVLVGTGLREVRDGFSRVYDGQGREQAVPISCAASDFEGRRPRWPLRLTVRHYFETDSRTGVVRVAASRLVRIRREVHQ